MKNDKSIILMLIFAIIVLIVTISMIFAQPEKPVEREITIEAKKFSYNPEIIEVNKGDLVKINFVSTDVHHGLYIDGYEIKVEATPGHEGNLTFVADKTGKFTMRCAVTCGPFHPYMISYLKVKPDYRLFSYIYLTLIIFVVSVLLISKRQDT